MKLIDADKAIEVANDLYEKYNFAMACADTQKEINHIFKRQELFKAVRAVIEHCPTIDLVTRGEWILKHIGHGHYWECSVCHTNSCIYVTEDTKFCPNCGAKMDGENR